MGDRGPAPRREAEVRRTNNKGKATQLTREQLQQLPFEIDLEPSPPDPYESWPAVLKDLWDALQVDPLRKWMTSADWATTKFVFEVTAIAMGATDEQGNTVGLNGSQQTAILKHLSNIGVTEDARLRLRKEITLFPARPAGTGDNVVDINKARQEEVQ